MSGRMRVTRGRIGAPRPHDAAARPPTRKADGSILSLVARMGAGGDPGDLFGRCGKPVVSYVTFPSLMLAIT
jgi:hypothetical protein